MPLSLFGDFLGLFCFVLLWFEVVDPVLALAFLFLCWEAGGGLCLNVAWLIDEDGGGKDGAREGGWRIGGAKEECGGGGAV